MGTCTFGIRQPPSYKVEKGIRYFYIMYTCMRESVCVRVLLYAGFSFLFLFSSSDTALCRYYFLWALRVHLPDKALINYIFFYTSLFVFFLNVFHRCCFFWSLLLLLFLLCIFPMLLKRIEKWHFTHTLAHTYSFIPEQGIQKERKNGSVCAPYGIQWRRVKR